jgi:predicted lipoprotein with Yx(FWY)xxD motif
MPATQNAGAAASSQRGVFTMCAALALLGLLGYLAAAGQLARGATRSHATVSLRTTSLGKVLVTSAGRTLYLFTVDKGRHSSCSGACAKFWPPLVAKAKPTAGPGVRAALLGRTRRADGRLQVTYAGHPLYTFAKDARAGQTAGEGFEGAWWAVSASGKAVHEAESGTTTTETTTTTGTTTTTPGYGGYG